MVGFLATRTHYWLAQFYAFLKQHRRAIGEFRPGARARPEDARTRGAAIGFMHAQEGEPARRLPRCARRCAWRPRTPTRGSTWASCCTGGRTSTVRSPVQGSDPAPPDARPRVVRARGDLPRARRSAGGDRAPAGGREAAVLQSARRSSPRDRLPPRGRARQGGRRAAACRVVRSQDRRADRPRHRVALRSSAKARPSCRARRISDCRRNTTVRGRGSRAGFPAAQWNALAGANPFLRHEFFAALHETGCASARTGWAPHFVTLWEGERLAGALPAVSQVALVRRVRVRLGVGGGLRAPRPRLLPEAPLARSRSRR